MYYTKYKSPIAPMILAGDEQGLAHLYFDVPQGQRKMEAKEDWEYRDEFFADVKEQLDEYFEGTRQNFTVKLNLKGTDFQQAVWQQLQKIPCGQTCAYKDIAQKIGRPKAYRAVGSANGKNPISLIVPCHRVVGADGGIAGYAFGTGLKEQLLEMEKEHCLSRRSL